MERRRLFSSLGYKSLFEYCVKELKYTEGQAGRRIQAMRLLKELPEIEGKIEKGEISLSNLSKAQSYFKEAKRLQVKRDVADSSSIGLSSGISEEELNRSFKLKVLKDLENKSSREGEKYLLKLLPEKPLPREKERILKDNKTEVKFIMSEELRAKLEEVRSLLGLKGLGLSFSEVLEEMAKLSLESLKIKKFGKKRVLLEKSGERRSKRIKKNTPAPELRCGKEEANEKKAQNHQRYISKSVKHKVWSRDQGKCTNCQSQINLNYDHIKPLALGGELKASLFSLQSKRSDQGFWDFKN